MKVYVERKDIKGDIERYEWIKEIIDNGDSYELVGNKNWSIIVSKKYNTIIGISAY